MELIEDFSEALTVVANAATPIAHARATVAGAEATPDEITPSRELNAIWSPLGYLRAEFPSQWSYLPHVSSTITNSLAKFFLSFLPVDPRIERVYWAYEVSVLRIWTIVDNPDDVVEEPIYEAQLRFMDKFPDLECDFSVIYRLGKPVEDIRPEGAHLVSREP